MSSLAQGDSFLDGFDTIALVDKVFGNGNIAAMNAKLHESTAYNFFQVGVNVVAVLTGGMTSTMSCFVAGTLVMTAAGLVAIETVKVGDYVLSKDINTMQTEYKAVLETYIRKSDKLVHLIIAGEKIITTYDHPFYVNGQGFVNAVNLCIGMELMGADGGILKVEQIYRENLFDGPRTVYNFKVEDFHTYFVGERCVLVHNADYAEQVRANAEQGKQFEKTEYEKLLVEEPDTVGQVTIKVNKTGERVRVDFVSGNVENGTAINPKLTEVKSSSTATFTKNQQTGYPSLAKNGGVVVGKGKGNFFGGTQIPPTEVNVIRPDGTQPLFSDIIGKKFGG